MSQTLCKGVGTATKRTRGEPQRDAHEHLGATQHCSTTIAAADLHDGSMMHRLSCSRRNIAVSALASMRTCRTAYVANGSGNATRYQQVPNTPASAARER